MSRFDEHDSFDELCTAGEESSRHLWPKVELELRRRDGCEPVFEGEYRFEKTVADRVPDCFILGDEVNRWIEFVAGSDQEYRAKTREALRLGFVVHWVFDVECDHQIQKAQQELDPDLREPFRFGRFDPDNDILELGTPVTFKNYEFPVESMREFSRDAILGYRRGAARILRHAGGFDLGLFDLGGSKRRLIVSDPRGRYFRALDPITEDAPWGFPTRDGLKRLVEAEQVRRLGPVRHESRSE